MPKGHFYQRFSMHEQTLYDKKCMNMMKYALNTWLDATWGQQNHQQTKWDCLINKIENFCKKLNFPNPTQK